MTFLSNHNLLAVTEKRTDKFKIAIDDTTQDGKRTVSLSMKKPVACQVLAKRIEQFTKKGYYKQLAKLATPTRSGRLANLGIWHFVSATAAALD